MRFDFQTWNLAELTASPDSPAVVASDGQLTWAELVREAEKLGELFAKAGAAANRPVVIVGHKEKSFVAAMTGCLFKGIPYIPVDRVVPTERIAQIVDATSPAVIYRCDDLPLELSAKETAPKLTDRQDDPLVYVIFTSGSTGKPKGVQISREAVRSFAGWLRADFGLRPGEVFFNQAPFSFDLSVYEFMGFLAMGGTLVLANNALQKNSAALVETLQRNACSTWVSTPSFAKVTLREDAFAGSKLPALQTFLFCGEVLPHSTASALRERFPGARVLNTYGPTEATVATTLVDIDDQIMARFDPLPVGYQKPGTAVDIAPTAEFLNETLSASGSRKLGEIVIKGNNVSVGYLNDDDLNRKKFSRDGNLRVFKTGDLGYYEDDLLFFLGRFDNQVKLNGYRIELDDINAAIERHENVESAFTLPIRKEGQVRRLVTFVTSKDAPDKPARIAEIKAILTLNLPAYMLPSEIVLVGHLPYSANHKVDGKRLLEMYESQALPR